MFPRPKSTVPTAGKRSGFAKTIFPLLRPGVERLLRIRKLSNLFEQVRGKTESPGEFAETILEILGIRYEIPEKDIGPLREIKGPLILVANLPLGGAEALVMVRILSLIRPDFKLVANNLLGQITELENSLLVVDQAGTEFARNEKDRLKLVRYLKAGGLVGVFPAGDNPLYNPASAKFKDPEWDQNLARIILIAGATVVPVYFHGENSLLVQLAGLIHPKLQQRLRIRDITKRRSRELKLKIGKRIAPGRIRHFDSPESLIQYLRAKTFMLSTGFVESGVDFRLVRSRRKGFEASIAKKPLQGKLLEQVLPMLEGNRVLASQDKFVVFRFYKSEAPDLMREIGRQREIAFRAVGEGSGSPIDIDRFDDDYLQLVLWDKEEARIAGGYRIGKIDKLLESRGRHGIYTHSLFRIRPKLWKEIGKALEMGRSYIVGEYQRNILPLMLLWMAIGEYVCRNPEYKILIGPVSITAEMNPFSRQLLVAFLEENEMHSELENLVKPLHKFRKEPEITRDYLNTIAVRDLADVQDMISGIEDSEHGVPILLKHYLKLGGKLLAFNIDPDFSDVLDGLIMVDLTQTEERILKKYMGGKGMESFLSRHRMTLKSQDLSPET